MGDGEARCFATFLRVGENLIDPLKKLNSLFISVLIICKIGNIFEIAYPKTVFLILKTLI